MSTNRARSFGLAIIVAIGVIAAMAAMGLFSAGPAHAEKHPANEKVKFTPSFLDIDSAVAPSWTVEFYRAADAPALIGGDTINLTFPFNVNVPPIINAKNIKLTAGGKIYEPTSVAELDNKRGVGLTLPAEASSSTNPTAIEGGDKVIITFETAAGITNPKFVSEGVDPADNPPAASRGSVGITPFLSEPPGERRAGHQVKALSFVARVGNVEFEPTSKNVNAPAAWEVSFRRPNENPSVDLTWGTSTITMTFPEGVVVPATIDKSRVTVVTEGKDGGSNRPNTDPTVNGNTVTVELPLVGADTTTLLKEKVGSKALLRVKFSQTAGILNPSARGEAGTADEASAGSVETSEDMPARNAGAVTEFNPTISLDKSSSPQGGPVEVTLGGFTPGLQVTLGGAVTGSGTVNSDGTAVIAGTMGKESGPVTATDGAGRDALPATAEIMVTATLTATATGKAQDTITLEGRNYTPLSTVSVDDIMFGGKPIGAANVTASPTEKGSDGPPPIVATGIGLEDKDQDGDHDDFSIQVRIPSDAPSGMNQIKVTDAGDDAGENKAMATATVDVAARTVTLSPSSGAPGTAVTVSVTGFPAGKSALDANTITIKPDDRAETDKVQPPVRSLITTSSGGLSGTNIVTIPSGADEGTVEVTVSIQGVDGEPTKGSATFTVVSRGLTVSPASGPKGTSILLSGGNYTPSGIIRANGIEIGDKGTLHGAVTLDSTGSIPATSVIVPSDVSYGDANVNVTVFEDTSATSRKVTGAGTFTVTQPVISLEPASVAMGNDVMVTGEGWIGNSIVTIVMSGLTDDRALTTDVVTTDGLGGFTTSMTVPNNVGVGPDMVSVDADDGAWGNETLAVDLNIPAGMIALSPSGTATVGDRVQVTATGFTPSTGLSELTIGGADVREGVVVTDEQGNLTTSFTVPGLTGAQLVKLKIGNDPVSTSLIVEKGTASAVTDPRALFASEIASGNLVRIFYFDNGTKQFSFFDPAFDDDANTLNSIVKGQIVDIGVNADTTFRGVDLTPVYNRIALP